MKREELIQFCTKAVNIIDEESNNFAILKDGFNSYIDEESNLKSMQFMQMVKCFKRILNTRAFYREEAEDEKKASY